MRALAMSVTLILVCAAAVRAQSIAAPALKAAFLLNFARFTEWPADTVREGSPLVLCVDGDDNVADALTEIVQGRMVAGHALTVRRLQAGDSAHGCHVLYLSHLDLERRQTLIDTLEGNPVLTVSDADGFATSGGIAGLYEDRGKMRFAINTNAAGRAGLRFSSRLLSLSHIVEDAPSGTRH
jgi:hypothetical protein